MNLIGWFVTTLALYGILLGSGCLIFHQWLRGTIYIIVGIVAGYFTWKIMSGGLLSSLNDIEETASE